MNIQKMLQNWFSSFQIGTFYAELWDHTFMTSMELFNFCTKLKMLSKAEPDTSLEHLQKNQTPVQNTVQTLIILILIIALNIQFLWIPSIVRNGATCDNFIAKVKPLSCNAIFFFKKGKIPLKQVYKETAHTYFYNTFQD